MMPGPSRQIKDYIDSTLLSIRDLTQWLELAPPSTAGLIQDNVIDFIVQRSRYFLLYHGDDKDEVGTLVDILTASEFRVNMITSLITSLVCDLSSHQAEQIRADD